MIIKGNVIYADDNKILRRLVDQQLVGSVYSVGLIYYLDGEKLDEPYQEKFSDFEELSIDDYIKENYDRYSELVEGYIRKKYSLNEELALQRQRDTKPKEFQEYFDYCEECKTQAKHDIGLYN